MSLGAPENPIDERFLHLASSIYVTVWRDSIERLKGSHAGHIFMAMFCYHSPARDMCYTFIITEADLILPPTIIEMENISLQDNFKYHNM